MTKRRWSGWLAGLATGAMIAAGCGGSEGGEAVARVNGTPLLKQEFEQRMTSLLIQNQAGSDLSKVPEALRKQAGKAVLESMIAQLLMYGAAVEAGAAVTEDEIELELSFSRARHASRSEFEEALEARGLTEANFRENLRRELMIQKYVETELSGGEAISDEQARAYYDANPIEFRRAESMRLRQIAVGVPKGADDEQRAAARGALEQAREKIVAGTDFAELARELSTDGGASLDGVVGDLTLAELVPPLQEAVRELPIGELSPVVDSRFGYHLLRVEARQDARELSYADAEEMIRQQLGEQRKRIQRDRWLKGLRAEARVEVLATDLVSGGSG